MQVTVTFKATSRKEWRDWLTQHHQSASEIWLLSDDRPGVPTVSYLDSVEEAICFGWIDGIAKRISSVEKAQRFTPRRPRSHWTELNKERTRRLIKLGLMTSAGQKSCQICHYRLILPMTSSQPSRQSPRHGPTSRPSPISTSEYASDISKKCESGQKTLINA